MAVFDTDASHGRALSGLQRQRTGAAAKRGNPRASAYCYCHAGSGANRRAPAHGGSTASARGHSCSESDAAANCRAHANYYANSK